MRGASLQSDEVIVLKAPWMVPDRPDVRSAGVGHARRPDGPAQILLGVITRALNLFQCALAAADEPRGTLRPGIASPLFPPPCDRPHGDVPRVMNADNQQRAHCQREANASVARSPEHQCT
jgi:hypothetical protein